MEKGKGRTSRGGKRGGGEEARVLGLGRVNRFLLRKQHLDPDSRGGNVVGVAGDIAGLHATSAVTPYLSLFARMVAFSRKMLDEELYVKRTLGKVRGVRGTMYIHPRDALAAAHASNRRQNIPESERFHRHMDRNEGEYEELSRRILELLRGRGMTASEIKREPGEEKSVSAVVNLMCDQGLLARGAPVGGWRSNVHTYHLFEEYLPGDDLAAAGEEEARREMVRRYLAAFGPAGEDDIAWWTGFRKGETRKILESMGGSVRKVGIEGMAGDLFMLKAEVEGLASTEPARTPVVNLLPFLDPYLMAYKARDRYLSPQYLPYIYDRGGNATNSILVDGRIVGVWDHEDKPPVLKTYLFEEAAGRTVQAINKQALRLGAFLSGGEVEFRRCEAMAPLAERTAGGFMTPLKGA